MESYKMEELINWYWEYGIKRGMDPNDPDRELRKISIGGWFDPLMSIIERNKDIKANIGNKCCLALWGPSQSGKSTLMSRYIDGYRNDGSDSALTWDEDKKTRFSPPEDGILVIPENTLIFNPFNNNSDASGVATRYILKSSESDDVNKQYPVEIKLTNRMQIIQSLSRGYLSECEFSDEQTNFTQETFLDELLSDSTDCSVKSLDAYLLLKDIANAIEAMQSDERFNNLFKKGEWSKKIRKTLVSAATLVSDINKAEEFLTKIFWDSNKTLTSFYKKLQGLLFSLSEEWKNCKILATLEVGALLLDIDTFKNYDSPNGEQGEKIKDKVQKLNYVREGNEIHVFIGNMGSRISGDEFGYFQALCSELTVPLKREALEVIPEKNCFLNLLEKCDILDFPGISNKDTGGVRGDAENNVLVNLNTCKLADVFTRVFKQGKTQCFVYNYAKHYGIDAFAILVRTANHMTIPKPQLLNAGIKDWIQSYDSEWKIGQKTDMPIFVNMTFFSTLLNNISMGGVGSGLQSYITRLQQLTFASKETAIFFPTTYPQFDDGRIERIEAQYQTIDAIINDQVFIPTTGIEKEALDSVYQNGGVDYMLKKMEEIITPEIRKQKCNEILGKDKKELIQLIESQLPSSEDTQRNDRKEQLHNCCELIKQYIELAQREEDISAYCLYANKIKKLFDSYPEMFDLLPQNAAKLTKKQLNDYIKNQVVKWYENKMSDLEDEDWLPLENQKIIISSLRDSFNYTDIFNLINDNFGQLNNQDLAKDARYPFSIAFNNILRNGHIEQISSTIPEDKNPDSLDTYIQAEYTKDSTPEHSPYYNMIVEPFMQRIEKLSENVQFSDRPPQPGDCELRKIYDEIIKK